MGNADILRKYHFVTSCWQKSTHINLGYLFFRWLLSTYHVGILCLALTTYESWLYFIYLTHWSYILIIVQSCLGTFIITARYFHQDSYERESIELSSLERIYVVLYTMALVQAPGISLLYWVLDDRPAVITILTHLEHTFNSVVMFLEFLVHGLPLNGYDFFWLLLFNSVYILFSVVYHWFDGINMNGQIFIYRLLDWTNVTRTLIICLMAFSMFVVLHFVLVFLSIVKFWACTKLVPKRLLTLPNKVTLV